MADAKLSALTELAAVDVAPATDLMYVDDISVTTGKKLTVSSARGTLSTEQASTSGVAIDFTGIPSGVKRITIMFVGVSTNGTSNLLIQLGDAGGIEATGYLGAGASAGASPAGANSTAGFIIISGAAANVLHGSIVLTLENSSGFMWTAAGSLALSNDSYCLFTAGRKATSAELTQVRITTVNGSDAFDAGAINISYE